MRPLTGYEERLVKRLEGSIYPLVYSRFKNVYEDLAREHYIDAQTPEEKLRAEKYDKNILKPQFLNFVEMAINTLALMELEKRREEGSIGYTAPAPYSSQTISPREVTPPENFAFSYERVDGKYRLSNKSDINDVIRIVAETNPRAFSDPKMQKLLPNYLFAWALIFYYVADETFEECKATASRLRELPEDVFQSTAVKIYQKIHLFDSRKSSFKNWVKTIVRNTGRDIARKERNRPEDPYPTMPELGASNEVPTIFESKAALVEETIPPETLAEIEDYKYRLEGFLKDYPNQDQVRIFKAIYFQGYGRREYAKKLGRSYDTLRSDLSRIVSTLKGVYPDIGQRLEEMAKVSKQLKDIRDRKKLEKSQQKEIPRNKRKNNPEESAMPKELQEIARMIGLKVFRNA